MTKTMWVSTPHSTCVVIVNADGRIVDTAPILWKAWLRRGWTAFHQAQKRRWGVQYLVERLPQEAHQHGRHAHERRGI